MAHPPFTVEYHHDPNNKFKFVQDTPDDEWLSKVGAEGWIVFSHDRKFHTILPECAAIKQHKIGCFYLWGANAPLWEKLHCFMGAYRRIAKVATTVGKPFIYDVTHNCQLKQIKIP
jgi:PIN like domain